MSRKKPDLTLPENVKLGEYQEMKVAKLTDFGAMLTPIPPKDAPENFDTNVRILLPKKECPSNLKTGTSILVFIYRDSMDRLIATTTEPLILLNEVERLHVKEVTKIGAFLEWGLAKDLLLPFKEQLYEVSVGDAVLVALYIDKSSRLCATMHVYDYLATDSNYIAGDEVDGRVYEISNNFGVFVAVDDKYSALIPKQDVVDNYKINQPVYARVSKVLDDGKLTLSTRKVLSEQMSIDSSKIHAMLKNSADGFLPFNDKSSPDDIRETFKMSKAQFKRAIGSLYRQQYIEFKDDGISLIEK